MPSSRRSLTHWLSNQPYLLLSLTPLFWAGNAVVGRAAAGSIPPVALSFLRWVFAFLIVLPFAWPHLKRDWPAIRTHLLPMALMSVTGISTFNTLQYWALEYTEALNALLIQSTGPLFVAAWSFAILRVRLTLAQLLGIVVSLAGVLVILTRGHLEALLSIQLNRGDIIFVIALFVFGLYSVLSTRRPQMHDLSFLAFTFGCGALFLVPVYAVELTTRGGFALTAANLSTLGYVSVFPSILAYLCFNRGSALIGANRAAPFFHLIPLFGSAMAIGFLGERFQLFHLAGYALVIVGVFIAARRASKAASITSQHRDAA